MKAHIVHMRPVAHFLHTLSNDYNRRPSPHLFYLALLGIVIAGIGFTPTSDNNLLAIFLIVLGILLILPLIVVAWLIRGVYRRRVKIRNLMVEQIQWRGDEQVLDMGTGSGVTLVTCAKKLTTGKAMGIDLWLPDSGGGTPAICWKNVYAEGVQDRADVRRMDARETAFPDDHFDVVMSSFMIHHIGGGKDHMLAAKEIYRVLKPGGQLVIFDTMHVLHHMKAALETVGLTNVNLSGEEGGLLTGQKPG